MNRERPLAPDEHNRSVFRSCRALSYYEGFRGLTPCETSLFGKHVPPDRAILDVGVGGGRTTPSLSSGARSYLGIDYSPEMIELCRSRFPSLRFKVADAAELGFVADDSVDVVVFSYNGMDYLYPREQRLACLQEFMRILTPGGVLIFSAHNARLLFILPALRGRGWKTASKALILESVRNVRRVAGIFNAAFWRGDGYVKDPALGGLTTHITTPKLVSSELAAVGFHLVATASSEYPRRTSPYATPWYYYVFLRPAEQPS